MQRWLNLAGCGKREGKRKTTPRTRGGLVLLEWITVAVSELAY